MRGRVLRIIQIENRFAIPKTAGDRRDHIRKGYRLYGSDALQVLESEMECDETAGDGRRPRAAICL